MYKRNVKGIAVFAIVTTLVLSFVLTGCTQKEAEDPGQTQAPKLIKIGAF
ncbi:MAG TPA: hypothetical protein GX512_05245 [Firmicutes bacterium]|nr:hypothetical protein [Candidatus Fermentithermobacillaceae bacterium]